MSLINDLLGTRKPGAKLNEFTGVASMPTIGAPMGLAVALKKKRKKNRLKEDGLIPDDANPLNPDSGEELEDELDDEGDGEGEGDSPELETAAKISDPAGLLPTSLALVAPDSTPDWNVPLCGALVPKPKTALDVIAPSSSPSSTVTAEPDLSNEFTQPGPMKDKAISVEGMLGLGRGSRRAAASASDGSAIASLVLNESLKSGEELLGQGKPMPEPVASNSARRTLGRFNFNS
jgi:hypothetical protein